MFNVFQKELINKEIYNKTIQESKERKIREKRKKILPDLVEKYDSRIKSFIIDMAHTPVKIKDYSSPIMNVRQRFMEDQIDKIKGKKGFVFKSFQNEKDRIKERLKQLEKDNLERNFLPEQIKLLQPTMRYKARTDLERIVDTVNHYSYGRASKWIINRQLKELDLNFAIKNESKRKNSIDSNEFQQFDFEHEILNENEGVIEKKKKRKAVDNSDAKNIMSELHQKTHFKAASVYTIQRSRNHNDNNNDFHDIKSSSNKTHLVNHNKRQISKQSTVIDSLNINPFHFKPSLMINNENLTYLHTLSNLPSLNQVLERSVDTKIDKKTVKFNKSDISDDSKKLDYNSNNLNLEERRKEEDIILIDKQPYNKNKLDVLSKVILKKCNFTHQKNKNNNVTHKIGEGKLMITSGLTIHDFMEKYHL